MYTTVGLVNRIVYVSLSGHVVLDDAIAIMVEAASKRIGKTHSGRCPDVARTGN